MGFTGVLTLIALINSQVCHPAISGFLNLVQGSRPSLPGAYPMSVLPKLLAGLTPPPVNVQEEYDGLQWRWKIFVFRPACMSFCDGYVDCCPDLYTSTDFTNEVFMIGALVFYVLFWWYGSTKNKQVANKWCVCVF